jgi:hypothetical protein
MEPCLLAPVLSDGPGSETRGYMGRVGTVKPVAQHLGYLHRHKLKWLVTGPCFMHITNGPVVP